MNLGHNATGQLCHRKKCHGQNATGQNATRKLDRRKNATKKKNNRGQNAAVLFCVSQMVIRSRMLLKTHKCYRMLA